MGKLTQEQIEEYYSEHLPYRNRILLAHKRLAFDKSYHGEIDILQACFEASLITGRMYLNVMGIRVDASGSLTPMRFRADDISAEDLGGSLCRVSSLTKSQQVIIAQFLQMADKGAAHLTMPVNHPWDKTHTAIDLIHDLIKEYIYKPTGRSIYY